jgi:hypothetical protein
MEAGQNDRGSRASGQSGQGQAAKLDIQKQEASAENQHRFQCGDSISKIATTSVRKTSTTGLVGKPVLLSISRVGCMPVTISNEAISNRLAAERMHSLTKIDVAIAQLRTAIRLFFQDADSVSVYVLASASREILTNLGNKLRLETYLDDMARWLETDVDTLRDKVVRPYNFMKHADRDPTATLDGFSDEYNDGLLFCACRDLALVAKGLPVEAQVYDVWFIALAVKQVNKGGLNWQKKIRKCIQAFPLGIRTANRETQKRMALDVLNEAIKLPELQMDIKRIIELPNED